MKPTYEELDGQIGGENGRSCKGAKMSAEGNLLKLQNLLIDKAFVLECAKHDTAKYGQWSMDYAVSFNEVDMQITNLIQLIDREE